MAVDNYLNSRYRQTDPDLDQPVEELIDPTLIEQFDPGLSPNVPTDTAAQPPPVVDPTLSTQWTHSQVRGHDLYGEPDPSIAWVDAARQRDVATAREAKAQARLFNSAERAIRGSAPMLDEADYEAYEQLRHMGQGEGLSDSLARAAAYFLVKAAKNEDQILPGLGNAIAVAQEDFEMALRMTDADFWTSKFVIQAPTDLNWQDLMWATSDVLGLYWTEERTRGYAEAQRIRELSVTGTHLSRMSVVNYGNADIKRSEQYVHDLAFEQWRQNADVYNQTVWAAQNAAPKPGEYTLTSFGGNLAPDQPDAYDRGSRIIKDLSEREFDYWTTGSNVLYIRAYRLDVSAAAGASLLAPYEVLTDVWAIQLEPGTVVKSPAEAIVAAAEAVTGAKHRKLSGPDRAQKHVAGWNELFATSDNSLLRGMQRTVGAMGWLVDKMDRNLTVGEDGTPHWASDGYEIRSGPIMSRSGRDGIWEPDARRASQLEVATNPELNYAPTFDAYQSMFFDAVLQANPEMTYTEAQKEAYDLTVELQSADDLTRTTMAHAQKTIELEALAETIFAEQRAPKGLGIGRVLNHIGTPIMDFLDAWEAVASQAVEFGFAVPAFFATLDDREADTSILEHFVDTIELAMAAEGPSEVLDPDGSWDSTFAFWFDVVTVATFDPVNFFMPGARTLSTMLRVGRAGGFSTWRHPFMLRRLARNIRHGDFMRLGDISRLYTGDVDVMVNEILPLWSKLYNRMVTGTPRLNAREVGDYTLEWARTLERLDDVTPTHHNPSAAMELRHQFDSLVGSLRGWDEMPTSVKSGVVDLFAQFAVRRGVHVDHLFLDSVFEFAPQLARNQREYVEFVFDAIETFKGATADTKNAVVRAEAHLKDLTDQRAALSARIDNEMRARTEELEARRAQLEKLDDDLRAVEHVLEDKTELEDLLLDPDNLPEAFQSPSEALPAQAGDEIGTAFQPEAAAPTPEAAPEPTSLADIDYRVGEPPPVNQPQLRTPALDPITKEPLGYSYGLEDFEGDTRFQVMEQLSGDELTDVTDTQRHMRVAAETRDALAEGGMVDAAAAHAEYEQLREAWKQDTFWGSGRTESPLGQGRTLEALENDLAGAQRAQAMHRRGRELRARLEIMNKTEEALEFSAKAAKRAGAARTHPAALHQLLKDRAKYEYLRALETKFINGELSPEGIDAVRRILSDSLIGNQSPLTWQTELVDQLNKHVLSISGINPERLADAMGQPNVAAYMQQLITESREQIFVDLARATLDADPVRGAVLPLGDMPDEMFLTDPGTGIRYLATDRNGTPTQMEQLFNRLDGMTETELDAFVVRHNLRPKRLSRSKKTSSTGKKSEGSQAQTKQALEEMGEAETRRFVKQQMANRTITAERVKMQRDALAARLSDEFMHFLPTEGVETTMLDELARRAPKISTMTTELSYVTPEAANAVRQVYTDIGQAVQDHIRYGTSVVVQVDPQMPAEAIQQAIRGVTGDEGFLDLLFNAGIDIDDALDPEVRGALDFLRRQVDTRSGSAGIGQYGRDIAQPAETIALERQIIDEILSSDEAAAAYGFIDKMDAQTLWNKDPDALRDKLGLRGTYDQVQEEEFYRRRARAESTDENVSLAEPDPDPADIYNLGELDPDEREALNVLHDEDDAFFDTIDAATEDMLRSMLREVLPDTDLVFWNAGDLDDPFTNPFYRRIQKPPEKLPPMESYVDAINELMLEQLKFAPDSPQAVTRRAQMAALFRHAVTRFSPEQFRLLLNERATLLLHNAEEREMIEQVLGLVSKKPDFSPAAAPDVVQDIRKTRTVRDLSGTYRDDVAVWYDEQVQRAIDDIAAGEEADELTVMSAVEEFVPGYVPPAAYGDDVIVPDAEALAADRKMLRHLAGQTDDARGLEQLRYYTLQDPKIIVVRRGQATEAAEAIRDVMNGLDFEKVTNLTINTRLANEATQMQRANVRKYETGQTARAIGGDRYYPSRHRGMGEGKDPTVRIGRREPGKGEPRSEIFSKEPPIALSGLLDAGLGSPLPISKRLKRITPGPAAADDMPVNTLERIHIVGGEADKPVRDVLGSKGMLGRTAPDVGRETFAYPPAEARHSERLAPDIIEEARSGPVVRYLSADGPVEGPAYWRTQPAEAAAWAAENDAAVVVQAGNVDAENYIKVGKDHWAANPFPVGTLHPVSGRKILTYQDSVGVFDEWMRGEFLIPGRSPTEVAARAVEEFPGKALGLADAPSDPVLPTHLDKLADLANGLPFERVYGPPRIPVEATRRPSRFDVDELLQNAPNGSTIIVVGDGTIGELEARIASISHIEKPEMTTVKKLTNGETQMLEHEGGLIRYYTAKGQGALPATDTAEELAEMERRRATNFPPRRGYPDRTIIAVPNTMSEAHLKRLRNLLKGKTDAFLFWEENIDPQQVALLLEDIAPNPHPRIEPLSPRRDRPRPRRFQYETVEGLPDLPAAPEEGLAPLTRAPEGDRGYTIAYGDAMQGPGETMIVFGDTNPSYAADGGIAVREGSTLDKLQLSDINRGEITYRVREAEAKLTDIGEFQGQQVLLAPAVGAKGLQEGALRNRLREIVVYLNEHPELENIKIVMPTVADGVKQGELKRIREVFEAELKDPRIIVYEPRSAAPGGIEGQAFLDDVTAASGQAQALTGQQILPRSAVGRQMALGEALPTEADLRRVIDQWKDLNLERDKIHRWLRNADKTPMTERQIQYYYRRMSELTTRISGLERVYLARLGRKTSLNTRAARVEALTGRGYADVAKDIPTGMDAVTVRELRASIRKQIQLTEPALKRHMRQVDEMQSQLHKLDQQRIAAERAHAAISAGQMDQQATQSFWVRWMNKWGVEDLGAERIVTRKGDQVVGFATNPYDPAQAAYDFEPFSAFSGGRGGTRSAPAETRLRIDEAGNLVETSNVTAAEVLVFPKVIEDADNIDEANELLEAVRKFDEGLRTESGIMQLPLSPYELNAYRRLPGYQRKIREGMALSDTRRQRWMAIQNTLTSATGLFSSLVLLNLVTPIKSSADEIMRLFRETGSFTDTVAATVLSFPLPGMDTVDEWIKARILPEELLSYVNEYARTGAATGNPAELHGVEWVLLSDLAGATERGARRKGRLADAEWFLNQLLPQQPGYREWAVARRAMGDAYQSGRAQSLDNQRLYRSVLVDHEEGTRVVLTPDYARGRGDGVVRGRSWWTHSRKEASDIAGRYVTDNSIDLSGSRYSIVDEVIDVPREGIERMRVTHDSNAGIWRDLDMDPPLWGDQHYLVGDKFEPATLDSDGYRAALDGYNDWWSKSLYGGDSARRSMVWDPQTGTMKYQQATAEGLWSTIDEFMNIYARATDDPDGFIEAIIDAWIEGPGSQISNKYLRMAPAVPAQIPAGTARAGGIRGLAANAYDAFFGRPQSRRSAWAYAAFFDEAFQSMARRAGDRLMPEKELEQWLTDHILKRRGYTDRMNPVAVEAARQEAAGLIATQNHEFRRLLREAGFWRLNDIKYQAHRYASQRVDQMMYQMVSRSVAGTRAARYWSPFTRAAVDFSTYWLRGLTKPTELALSEPLRRTLAIGRQTVRHPVQTVADIFSPRSGGWRRLASRTGPGVDTRRLRPWRGGAVEQIKRSEQIAREAPAIMPRRSNPAVLSIPFTGRRGIDPVTGDLIRLPGIPIPINIRLIDRYAHFVNAASGGRPGVTGENKRDFTEEAAMDDRHFWAAHRRTRTPSEQRDRDEWLAAQGNTFTRVADQMLFVPFRAHDQLHVELAPMPGPVPMSLVGVIAALGGKDFAGATAEIMKEAFPYSYAMDRYDNVPIGVIRQFAPPTSMLARLINVTEQWISPNTAPDFSQRIAGVAIPFDHQYQEQHEINLMIEQALMEDPTFYPKLQELDAIVNDANQLAWRKTNAEDAAAQLGYLNPGNRFFSNQQRPRSDRPYMNEMQPMVDAILAHPNQAELLSPEMGLRLRQLWAAYTGAPPPRELFNTNASYEAALEAEQTPLTSGELEWLEDTIQQTFRQLDPTEQQLALRNGSFGAYASLMPKVLAARDENNQLIMDPRYHYLVRSDNTIDQQALEQVSPEFAREWRQRAYDEGWIYRRQAAGPDGWVIDAFQAYKQNESRELGRIWEQATNAHWDARPRKASLTYNYELSNYAGPAYMIPEVDGEPKLVATSGRAVFFSDFRHNGLPIVAINSDDVAYLSRFDDGILSQAGFTGAELHRLTSDLKRSIRELSGFEPIQDPMMHQLFSDTNLGQRPRYTADGVEIPTGSELARKFDRLVNGFTNADGERVNGMLEIYGVDRMRDLPEGAKKWLRDEVAEMIDLGYFTVEDYNGSFLNEALGAIDYKIEYPTSSDQLDWVVHVPTDMIRVVDGQTILIEKEALRIATAGQGVGPIGLPNPSTTSYEDMMQYGHPGYDTWAEAADYVEIQGVRAPGFGQIGGPEAQLALQKALDSASIITLGPWAAERFGLYEVQDPTRGLHHFKLWMFIDDTILVDENAYQSVGSQFGRAEAGYVPDYAQLLEEQR